MNVRLLCVGDSSDFKFLKAIGLRLDLSVKVGELISTILALRIFLGKYDCKLLTSTEIVYFNGALFPGVTTRLSGLALLLKLDIISTSLGFEKVS
jgi:hypothetical protein